MTHDYKIDSYGYYEGYYEYTCKVCNFQMYKPKPSKITTGINIYRFNDNFLQNI